AARAERRAARSSVARYGHDVLHRQIFGLSCQESTLSGSTRRNIQCRTGRAGYGADASGKASGARERGAGSEDGAVRSVADLVNYDVAKIRRVGYVDSVFYLATLGARIARREARSGANRGVATLCHRNARRLNLDWHSEPIVTITFRRRSRYRCGHPRPIWRGADA